MRPTPNWSGTLGFFHQPFQTRFSRIPLAVWLAQILRRPDVAPFFPDAAAK
jgi:hypothetical protein